jgi:hypothetical protein
VTSRNFKVGEEIFDGGGSCRVQFVERFSTADEK